MGDLTNRTLLARYYVLERVGAGGMGDVYRAHDRVAGTTFALKVLHADLAEDPQFLRRFRREAAALQALNHPNIVRFYQLQEDAPLAFLVLDYIDGSTLRRELRLLRRPLTPGEALGYLRPIVAALG